MIRLDFQINEQTSAADKFEEPLQNMKEVIVKNIINEIPKKQEVSEIIEPEETVQKEEELFNPPPEEIIEKEIPQELPKEEMPVEKNPVISEKTVENIPVKPAEEYKPIQNTIVQPKQNHQTVAENKPVTNIMPLQNKTDYVSSVPAQPDIDINQITSAYTNLVRMKIESIKKYPKWALRQEFEGTVYVAFKLWKNGSISEIKLMRSSGYKILDNEALSSVNRAAPFPAIPAQLSVDSISMEIGIVFKIL